MSSSLRLPPVDKYRQPFVQPLGHLVIAWTRLELAVVRFFGMAALSPSERLVTFDWDHGETARRFRHWSSSKAEERIFALGIRSLEEEVIRSWRIIKPLQAHRNRLIHDVINIGLFESENGGWEVSPLLGPNIQLVKWDPKQGFQKVTPEYVAEVAHYAHEVALEFEGYAERLPRLPLEDDEDLPNDE